jgi:hypothetical protein
MMHRERLSSRSKREQQQQQQQQHEEEQEGREEEQEMGQALLIPAAALAATASAFAAYKSAQSLGQARQANEQSERANELLVGGSLGVNGDWTNVTASNTGRLISSDAETVLFQLSSRGMELSKDLRNTPIEVYRLTTEMDDALEQVTLAYAVLADRHADNFYITSALSVGGAICAANLLLGFRRRTVQVSALGTAVVSALLALNKIRKEAQREDQLNQAWDAAHRLLTSLQSHRSRSQRVQADLVHAVQTFRSARKNAAKQQPKQQERKAPTAKRVALPL